MTPGMVCAAPITSCGRGVCLRLLRFCIPTIADGIFIIFLLRVLQLGATGLFNDPGTGWHLRIGEGIVSTRAFPDVDMFSYTRRGQPWVETQWLGDVILSLAFSAGGYSLIALGTAAMIAAVFRWLYRTHASAGGWPAVAAVVVLTAACAASGHFLARPLVATTVGVPLCFWWTTQYARGAIGAKRLWLLVPLAVVWANVHPGVLGGIATVVLCGGGAIAGAMLERRGETTRWANLRDREYAASENRPSYTELRRSVMILAVGGAMAAATLFNPYGTAWHRQIATLMSMKTLHQYVDEWMPPDRAAPATIAAVLLVGTAAVASIVRRNRTTVPEGVVILFWAWQGFRGARHLPLLAIIAALQLGRLLADVRVSNGWLSCVGARVPLFSASMREAEFRTGGGLASVAFVAVLTAMLAAGIAVPAIGLGVARPPERKYSGGAIAYLRANPPPGPLLNDLDYGGMLIHDVRGVPVFIDDRFELYGEAFIGEYRSAVLRPEVFAGPLLDRWDIQAVVIRNALPLGQWLAANPAWAAAYRDPVAAVYTRTPGPQASYLLGSPACGQKQAGCLHHNEAARQETVPTPTRGDG